MRSCSSSDAACSSSEDSVLTPPSSPVLIVRRNSVTRSTRCSARPQLWAMSVALLAQGETVPRRGITTTSAVSAASAVGPS